MSQGSLVGLGKIVASSCVGRSFAICVLVLKGCRERYGGLISTFASSTYGVFLKRFLRHQALSGNRFFVEQMWREAPSVMLGCFPILFSCVLLGLLAEVSL